MQQKKYCAGMFFEEFCGLAGTKFPYGTEWFAHVPALLQEMVKIGGSHAQQYRDLVRTVDMDARKRSLPWVLDLGGGRTMPYSLEGRELHFVAHPSAYQSLDFVTDCFTEEARMNSRRRDSLAPAVAFADPEVRQNLLVDAYRAYAAGNNPETVPECCTRSNETMARFFLRQSVYRNLKECGNFKVSFAAHIYKFFRSTRVLDPFAGWGDRAIGAALVPEVTLYVGVDSNPELATGYRRIQDTFRDTTTLHFIVPQKFENANIEDILFDMVLASPPFFDLEIYGQGQGQCHDLTTTDDWVSGWLVPCLEKAICSLRAGGFLVLYLCDTQRLAEKRYLGLCHDMLVRRNFWRIDFLGTIATLREKDSRRVMPLFVYRKKC